VWVMRASRRWLGLRMSSSTAVSVTDWAVFQLSVVKVSAAGDTVAVHPRAREQLRIQNALEIARQLGFPEWLQVDEKALSGTVKSLPEREEILPDINESLVVELYSK